MPCVGVQLPCNRHRLQVLARLAEALQRTRENHSPRRIGDAPPQLAVDEIAEAPEAKADRHQRRDEVDRIEEIDVLAPRPDQAGTKYAEQSAMEGHAAFP